MNGRSNVRAAVVIAGILFASSAIGADDTGSIEHSKHAYARCSSCHGRPDPASKSGRLWIARIAKTACVQPIGPKSKTLRDQLIAFLRSDVGVAPCESKARDAGQGDGRIMIAWPQSAERVEILLTAGDDAARDVRLVWDRDRQPRTVRAGRYRVQRYTVTARDQKQHEYQLWASGAGGREIRVLANQTASLDIDFGIAINVTNRAKEGKLQLGIQPSGDREMGVTIVRDGQRVPALYRITAGQTLQQGHLTYG